MQSRSAGSLGYRWLSYFAVDKFTTGKHKLLQNTIGISTIYECVSYYFPKPSLDIFSLWDKPAFLARGLCRAILK